MHGKVCMKGGTLPPYVAWIRPWGGLVMGSITVYLFIGIHAYVTGFAKRGLPHTSDLQASIIHNLRCVKAMDLEIVQFRPLA